MHWITEQLIEQAVNSILGAKNDKGIKNRIKTCKKGVENNKAKRSITKETLEITARPI